ncbi:MAG: (deoxy)nucleoside triphosphate pyrophosphohydrolase [Arcticibacter sp.]
MKEVEVVAAIIIHKGHILCCQRGNNKYSYLSKKWEFPGGKIEEGETKEETIRREIKEELNMDIIVMDEFIKVNHQYPDFNLTMHSFICDCASPELTLTEHTDYKWLSKNDMEHLDWAAADIPIVNKLKNSSNEL